MIDADIKKEFSKAMSYQEVFMLASKLKAAGENVVKVNKFMTARRNELAKQVSKIKPLKITQIDTKMKDSEDVMTYLNIDYRNNGSVIEYDGKAVILR